MKPEAQRIAIAEACGIEIPAWVKARGETEWWVAEIGGEWRELPDYLNDLNAIASARAGLSEEAQWDFVNELSHLADARGWTESTGAVFRLINATAKQQSEAFLRVLKLWQPPSLPSLPAKEGKP